MNTKEFKIQIPKGYEVDKENSTFECIKFKPVKRDITYNDICYILFKDKNSFFTTTSGHITNDTLAWAGAIEKNNATNREQLERLLALNQLLNIAKYYNILHPLTGKCCRIVYYKRAQSYQVYSVDYVQLEFSISVIFNRKEDAKAVIDNPNFREVLDKVYKN